MIRLLILLAFTVVFCGEEQPAVETFTVNGVTFKMIKVDGGTFNMGAQSSDPDGINYDPDAEFFEENELYEDPVHSVTLTNNFYMAETEITQALWEAVTGKSLMQIVTENMVAKTYGVGDNYPMYLISWKDMVGTEKSAAGYTINGVTYYQDGFCYKLSQLVGSGKQFRLPTEAEWEYAARGGSKAEKQTKYSGSDNIDDVAWHNLISGNSTQEVATKQSNALGIYDMSGNIFEGCSDWYGRYSSGNQTNPVGADTNRYGYVSRGGSHSHYEPFCRVSARLPMNTETDGLWIGTGFRLALSASQGCDVCK